LANPQKNPGICLDIAQEIDMPVTFYGEGTEKIKLQESARVRGINADFAGQVIDPWEFIGESDVLIIPSRFEGDGLVVIEGMHQEIPMLIADIPDFRRFKLPEQHYCKSVGDFIFSINRFKADILSLKVPREVTSQILASRSPETVGDAWEEFLYSI
jgi:glycosyltransferase involved in cell wall biosynthesis